MKKPTLMYVLAQGTLHDMHKNYSTLTYDFFNILRKIDDDRTKFTIKDIRTMLKSLKPKIEIILNQFKGLETFYLSNNDSTTDGYSFAMVDIIVQGALHNAHKGYLALTYNYFNLLRKIDSIGAELTIRDIRADLENSKLEIENVFNHFKNLEKFYRSHEESLIENYFPAATNQEFPKLSYLVEWATFANELTSEFRQLISNMIMLEELLERIPENHGLQHQLNKVRDSLELVNDELIRINEKLLSPELPNSIVPVVRRFIHDAHKQFMTVSCDMYDLEKAVESIKDNSEIKKKTGAVVVTVQKLYDLCESYNISLPISNFQRKTDTNRSILTNLTNVLKAKVHSFQEEFAQKRIHLIDHFSKIEIQIECEEALIGDVLFNIIKNALEALKQRGHLEIKVEKVRDEFVKIRIIDDGIGINNDIKEIVGEPYVTDKPNSAGLGLTLSKHYIELHDGFLSWDSKNGKTEFTILLPIKQSIV